MSMRRLRVVYIDHCARLSGGELALVRLLGAMDGVESHVLLAEHGPLVSRLQDCGAEVEVLPMGRRTRNLRRDKVGASTLVGPRGAESAAYAIRLARRIRQIRPDIVHTSSLKAALYGGMAAKLARVPLVIGLNDRIAEDYLPPSAVRVVRLALLWMPDAIVANSRATMSTLAGPNRRWSGPPAFVIYPPVPLHPDLECQPGKTLRIGMVGRLGPTNGQRVFLHALAQAFGGGLGAAAGSGAGQAVSEGAVAGEEVGEGPGGSASDRVDGDGARDWEAIVVGAPMFGDSEDDYTDGLHTLASALGLADRVTFIGFSDEVPQELAQMDILVHASVSPEPFGLVVVEAMAAGLAVIATTPGGPAEVIEDGITGLLYPPGDIEALAAALRRLAADPALRTRLGAAAKLKSADFAPAIAASEMLQVYKNVLSASSTATQP